ncbi:transcription repressor OFP1 [Brachypodium distachyon]|nr:transcription repressor OFP1 [Brachypodium distachyon]|eukprot:XP_014754293.2 transcription repressor OFP1 [Brachypodium distachyon]
MAMGGNPLSVTVVSGEPRRLTPTVQSEDETGQNEHLTPHAWAWPPLPSSRSRYLCFSGPKSLWSCASSVFSSLAPASSHHSEQQSGRVLLAGNGKGKGKAMAGGQRRSFRMSDMIPNAWFYKLRDMRARGGRGRGPAAARRSLSARWEDREVQQQQQQPSSRWNREVSVQQPPPPSSPSPGNREDAVVDVLQQPAMARKGSPPIHLHRASYYTATRDRELAPPRRRRHRAPAAHGEKESFVVQAPVSVSPRRRRDMSIDDLDAAVFQKPMVIADPSDDDNNNEGNVIATEEHIVIDLVRDKSTPETQSVPVLPPIVTTPVKKPQAELPDAMATGAGSASEKSNPRRSSSSKPRRVKTRATRSPRLAAPATAARKGAQSNWTAPPPASPPPPSSPEPEPDPILDSYAVVVLSSDIRKDFRESMEEMIADKGIRDAADLEDLLACYLVLNEAKFHEIIVEVFEEIWISLANARP